MTVGEIIAAIKKKSGATVNLETTGDRLICGSEDNEVHKIATTFMATCDVIAKACEQGVDFIITHEPTYFTGPDRLDWLGEDPVYQKKKAFIDKVGISVWRFHDYMHLALEGDLIYEGMFREFGWTWRQEGVPGTARNQKQFTQEIPPTKLLDLVKDLKEKLNLPVLRYIGNPDMICRKVGLLAGGSCTLLDYEEHPMVTMEQSGMDVAICGDIHEWTMPAYIRDAYQMGMMKAMIIPGHDRTEEAGMKYLHTWLQPLVGEIPIVFLESGDPFQYA